mgnify:CR=1 FL=1
MKTTDRPRKELILNTVSTLFLLASIGFNVYLFLDLRKQNLELLSSLEISNAALSITESKLASTTIEKLKVADNLQKERENTYLFQNQIQNFRIH